MRPCLEALEDRTVPTTIFVNVANKGTQDGSAAHPWASIQQGVNQAHSSDIVQVAAGTYNESVSVFTPGVVIRGAEAGIDARTRTGLETIVQGPGGQTAIRISANDVTLDGFTVQNATNTNNIGSGIYVRAGINGFQFVNNIVQNNIVGLFISNSSTTDPALVRQNLFRNNNKPGPASGHDIYADDTTAGAGAQGFIITNNTFTNSSFTENHWCIGFGNVGNVPFNQVQILNNTFNNSGRGVYFEYINNVTVSGNSITGTTHWALGALGLVNGLLVSGNTIQSGAVGVLIIDGYGTPQNPGPNSNIHILNNAMVSTTAYVLSDKGYSKIAYTGTVDVNNNVKTVPTTPLVYTDPTNLTVGDGQTVSFSAAAFSSPAPSVQWQMSTDGGNSFQNILGATSTTLSFTAALAQNGQQYRAVFKNANGTTSSKAATLSVVIAPVVTTSPVSKSVNAGQSVSFTADATGAPTPGVQWQVSTDGGNTFSNIAGATSNTLTFTTTAAQNGNQYQAVYSNPVITTSSAATLTVNFAPSVTTQPKSQTITSGQTVTFTAAAPAYPPAAVQWQVSTDGGNNFSDIGGATSPSLSFVVQPGQGGYRYRAVFTNSLGTVTTQVATLTVNVPPTVTTDPTNQAARAGQTATFTAAASGIPAPTVQWQFSSDGGKNFANIPGATSTTYSFTMQPGKNGTQYRAVFTNPYGKATTKPATMTLNVAPAVLTSPSSQIVIAGNMATFTATASGTPAPTVQWQVSTDGGKTFSNISGANSTTLSFAVVPGQNTSQYQAVFTNLLGTVKSKVATLTVYTKPTVTNPSDQTVTAGQKATFTVSTSGFPNPGIQWQVKSVNSPTFTNIAGATLANLIVTTSTALNGNQYRAVVTNAAGSVISSVATLTVNLAPAIIAQPINQTVTAGNQATFIAAVNANPPATVQWYFSSDGGKTYTTVANATSPSLKFTAQKSNMGLYKAIFTNSIGSVTTTVVSLTVK